MTGSGDCIDRSQVIGSAGSVLRALTPAKIATLVFIRSRDISQREIADRLGRTPPAISNYIETFENLPRPLVRKEGHDHWMTSEGKQVVSAIHRFTTNLGVEIESVETDTAIEREQLEGCLSPLHEFRSNPPFFVLYALGTTDSAQSVDREPIPIGDIVSTVKDWLDDSITRTQIRSRLQKFGDSGTIDVDGSLAKLTDKGIEQWRLLDQIMKLFLDTSPVEANKIMAAYQSDTGEVLSLPQSATVEELETMISSFTQENENDLSLELVTQTRTRSTD